MIKKTITKKALKASGQTDLSGNASKDLLQMHKVIFTFYKVIYYLFCSFVFLLRQLRTLLLSTCKLLAHIAVR
ncbi:unnamed protein product [Brassica oleracea var. botrytis]